MSRAGTPRLGHLARPGAELRVRALPQSRRPGVTETGCGLRVAVTEPAEGGRANLAVQEALA